MAHGLFDIQLRLLKIDQNGDPLVDINRLVNWELFRKDLEDARDRERGYVKTSDVGRPPLDVIILFKMLVIQSLHNLSDEALEKQCLDRLTFMRFLGIDLNDDVPDAKSIWNFKEMLKRDDLVKTLFLRFDSFLRENGFEAKKGQIVDATIVQTRIRRDSREINKQVKEGDGENVKEWSDHTRCQKDIDARWTKKRNKSYFGYKDHESVDVKHKIIREYHITSASVHDSQVYEELITPNEQPEEYADSAYRSEDRIANRILAEKIPHFQEKGTRGHPLTAEQHIANRLRSKVRSRVEHVFGAKVQRAGNLIIRTIGIARARVKLGLRNLAYNLERFTILKKREKGANQLKLAS